MLIQIKRTVLRFSLCIQPHHLQILIKVSTPPLNLHQAIQEEIYQLMQFT